MRSASALNVEYRSGKCYVPSGKLNYRKLLVALLLLFSTIPLLTTQQVSSQSYTTLTTELTTVSTMSYTITGLTPISSYAITTTSRETISYVWTHTGDSKSCINDWFRFDAIAGQTVDGTITADKSRMVVYLLSDQQFAAWGNQDYCDPTDSGIGVQWRAGRNSNPILQANVHWTASASGTFWFIVETLSSSNVVITVNLSKVVSETSTEVVYSTLYSTKVNSFSLTLTSVTIQQVPQLFGLGEMPLLIMGIVIFAILALTVCVFRRRSRSTRREVNSSPDRETQKAGYVEYLAKLEDLKTRGQISEETYLKLKKEFWGKLEQGTG